MKIKPEDAHVSPRVLFQRAKARMTLGIIDLSEGEGLTNDELTLVLAELIKSLMTDRVHNTKQFRARENGN